VGCTGAAPEVQVVYGRGRCSTSLTNSIRLHVQWHPIFRYLPSIKRPPSEANLRRARERLGSIKQQIQLDTFAFEEEVPDYRFLGCLSGTSSARLCSDIFDAYLTHRQARLHRNDMAAATVRSYRKILDGIWRPHLGDLVFPPVFRRSATVRLVDRRCTSLGPGSALLEAGHGPVGSVRGNAGLRCRRQSGDVGAEASAVQGRLAALAIGKRLG
jgi:hypothetical protein